MGKECPSRAGCRRQAGNGRARNRARAPQPELSRRYRRLSLRDVFLGYAGHRSPGHPVHRAIAALSPGDPFQVRVGADRWELLDRNGTVVGQLARGYEAPTGMRSASATVMAVVNWDRASVLRRSTGTAFAARVGKP